MKLTLAEALPLKKQISKVLHEKIRERSNNAYVEFEKGEDLVEEPSKSFKEMTSEIDVIRNDYRTLDFLLDKANIDSILTWEEIPLSIKEAIELSKQLRGEVGQLIPLSTSKKMEKVVSYHRDSGQTYRKAMFNPDEIADDKNRLEKKANKLSMLIEKTNHQYEIDFSEADKYL